MLSESAELPYQYPIAESMKKLTIFLTCLIGPLFGICQGKVVINEFMPWTSNTCGGPTAEFVELLNFGPGPMNIGCYILTDGDFSITIPPNTILQPGQFFLISGQDIILAPCANINSDVTTDLNWNTCNCTSGTIPTTGDGLFTDGGSANEQVVLLSPSLTVVDAVVRSLPVESSALITTSSLGGQCTQRTFDLDLISINYETIGESAGRGNSFARKLDGDCGWVKDPQQSADATNNTPSDVSDIDYDFAVTNTTTCSANGSIEIIVNAANYTDIFPMNYTLAFDTDYDYLFETTDSYTTGTVINPNRIIINNLTTGNYRITVESVKGCFLQTFPFTILNCNPVLPFSDIVFKVTGNEGNINCQWDLHASETISHVVIEAASDGQSFYPVGTVNAPPANNGGWNAFYLINIDPAFRFFRLRVISVSGKQVFSNTTQLFSEDGIKIWPNPAREKLFLSVQKAEWDHQPVSYSILNTMNQLVARGHLIMDGRTLISIPVTQLPAGSYRLILQPKNSGQHSNPVSSGFIKL
jgi:hypothetical protein